MVWHACMQQSCEGCRDRNFSLIERAISPHQAVQSVGTATSNSSCSHVTGGRKKQPWSGKPKRELDLIARLNGFDFFAQARGKQQHRVMEAEKRQADSGKPVVLNFVEKCRSCDNFSLGWHYNPWKSGSCTAKRNEWLQHGSVLLFYFSSVRFLFRVDVFYSTLF